MPRKAIARTVQASVLVALVGSSLAFVALDRTVTLSIDGHRRTVHTFARSVAGVLDRAGVRVGAHDSVTPKADTPAHDGDTIVVRHGREMTLAVDGRRRTVWVTAATVAEALDQLGVRDEGAHLSASRDRAVPMSGMTLSVRLVHHVAVWVDGHLRNIRTTAPTVATMLAENGITLGPLDTSTAKLSARPADGLRMHISRVRDGQQVQTVAVPFLTARRPDASMYTGKERVAEAGVDGVMRKVYAVHTIDGRVRSRRLVSQELLRHRQDKIVYYGTTARPAPAPAPRRATGGAAGLNWPALARCESGGNPRAVSSNGRYRGLYQFSLGTWHSVGGAGDPIDATSGEQTYRAEVLYNRDGDAPWPVCGHHLYD